MSKDYGPSGEMAAVRDAAKRLNALTDRAAEAVRAVEQFLNSECSLGVAARVQCASWVIDDEVGHISYGVEQWLCYERIGGRFRIAVHESSDPDPDGATTAWSDCSRETKLATVEHLPQLLAEIARTVNETIANAERRVNAACAALDAFGK